MAIYRQIHTTFWKDRRVGEWGKDEKLFYIYLLTNDYTTQCGVYEFNHRYAQFELGMDRAEIDQHIQFLVSKGRIVYNEKSEELMIVNWLKYNSAASPKVAAVIDRELREIKTLEFESEVIKKCLSYGYPIKTKEPKKDTLSIQYPYPIDTLSENENRVSDTSDTISQQNRTLQNNTEQHNTAAEQQGVREATPGLEPAPADLNPYLLYQQSFGVLSSTISEDVAKWVADLGEELVCEAMKRAAFDQKGYRYAQGIMRSWAVKNIKTMDEVAADDVRYENNRNKHQKAYGKPYKTESLPDWDSIGAHNERSPEEQAALQAELDRKMAEFLKDDDA